jgi:hypothetical protein
MFTLTPVLRAVKWQDVPRRPARAYKMDRVQHHRVGPHVRRNVPTARRVSKREVVKATDGPPRGPPGFGYDTPVIEPC